MKQHKAFLWILAALLAFDGFLYFKVFSASDLSRTEVYFFDVGQGDGSLIVTETGVRILIDGGREDGNILREVNKVLGKDKYIDLLVMSHAQADHVAGFLDILNQYDVGALIGSGRKDDQDFYKELLEKIRHKSVPYIALFGDDSILFGEESIAVLSPSDGELLSSDLNDSSLVMLFDGADFSVLYTGDAGVATEKRLTREYDLNADVLKVGHHGSKTSSDFDFLQELLPLASVISVGENSYGHPNPEVLDRLFSVSKVFRTDEEGTIKISSAAGELVVERAQ